ncbi:MAG: RNA methyltransferase [Syntrophus sp. (in: bacteria)]|nr:RNA methyltransferase [Syntrophus sp. (in: bacteria)]
MSIWLKKSKIVATCAKGISPYLQAEMRALDFPIHAVGEAAVETEGTLEDAMTLNLNLRTAPRVLFLYHACTATTLDELYRRLVRLSWEEVLDTDGYVCVTSFVDTPAIRDGRIVNLKGKDAVADRFRQISDRRPDSGAARDRTVIHLYWKQNQVLVYLDTSGDSLSKRGYRKIPLQAPMQETLAASVILAAGWQGEGNFVNPMCGSGTLAIEAALIALNRAPGLVRTNYGFMHLKGFTPSCWRDMRTRARKAVRKELPGKIVATDVRREAVEAARQNARTAGVDHLIDFAVCDFRETPVPEGNGMIMLNPAYGERLGEIASLEVVYQGIGDFFKQQGPGYRGYIFTGNLDLAKKIGLKTKRRVPFFNGEIECRLLEYELYAGSLRRPPAEVEVTDSGEDQTQEAP